MATRTWNSGASTDGNLATNYDGEGGLLVTDDIVFDGTSVVNCTFTAPLSVASITVAAGYTGLWNDGGFAMQTSGAVSITPGGTFTATGTWTQTGDANWTYANAGTYVVTAQSIVLQGTGTLTFAKNNTRVANITCAAAGKVTTVAAFGNDCGWNTTLTLSTGTLTINTQFNWYGSAVGALTPIVNGGATINGNQRLYLRSIHAAAAAISIPALTMGGTTALYIPKQAGNAVATYTVGGALVVPTLNVYSNVNNAAAGVVFNTGDFAITVAGDLSWGNNTAAGSCVLNMGASVITLGTCGATSWNNGPSTINLGTSVWTCTGAWTSRSNHTIVPGLTSVINFTGLNSTFTTAGKNFGGIVSNKNAGQTLTQAGALNCAAFTVAGGNFTSGNNAITASGNVLMGGGTLNLGTSAVTCSGNAITARISATTRTTATSVWTFSGTSAVLDLANGGATTISRLILQAAAAYTWTATANVLTISTYTATDWDSTTWTSGTPGTSAAILAPAGVVVAGMTVTDSNNSGVTIDASDATNADGGGNTGWTFPVTDQNMVGQTMAGAAGAAGGAGM